MLIVDDEEAVHEVSSKALEMYGFQVLTANDGKERLQQFELHVNKINLVVLDLTMPIMDGKELFQKIMEISPKTPVILSSGYAEEEATENFRGIGLAGFLQKPYSPTTLLSKINGVLQAKSWGFLAGGQTRRGYRPSHDKSY